MTKVAIIKRDDDLAYENLTLIISEFEKAALMSATRNGAMVVAHSPLSAMDNLLISSDKALSAVAQSREKSTNSPIEAIKNFAMGEGPGVGFSADADLLELFGGEDNPVKNYLEECLGCNLRLQFDWQLKPINLLGGIQALIDGVNQILDALQLQLDPGKTLADICDLLNKLKGLCIPDLIMILLSLKLLLKKYISDAIQIKLDWTVILGPILKAILEGIALLLEQLAGVILAPINCALNALTTANELEREARMLAGQVAAFATHTKEMAESIGKGQIPGNVGLEGVTKTFSWGQIDFDVNKPQAPSFGQMSMLENFPGAGSSLEFGAKPGGFAMPTGFLLTQDTRLLDALNDPRFANSTITEKLILPVQEAKFYIQNLLRQLILAINSAQALVSGGLAVQVGNIGIIMFLSDMISLVMMIINLLRSNRHISDWCKHLEDNPGLLEEAMRARFGPSFGDIRVEKGADHSLILKNGPNIISEIKTCVNARSGPDKQMLDQWIQDLHRKAGS